MGAWASLTELKPATHVAANNNWKARCQFTVDLLRGLPRLTNPPLNSTADQKPRQRNAKKGRQNTHERCGDFMFIERLCRAAIAHCLYAAKNHLVLAPHASNPSQPVTPTAKNSRRASRLAQFGGKSL